ncbi:MAG: class I SAM-dependent methyltransferase [Wenzhouxiangellaceae bacterium]
MGVRIHGINPFHQDHPYCNKLTQLQTPELAEADICVLCDTDIAFSQSVDSLLSTSSIRAKIVDLPNPPIEIWRALLDASGLPQCPTTNTSFGDGITPTINCNGGLYMIPSEHFRILREAWPRWARWLIDHIKLIPESYQKHIDQMSFGLAVHQFGLPIKHLSLAENYPTHSSVGAKPDISPKVIHYHSNVDSSHRLKQVGAPLVDKRIGWINRMIHQRRRESFGNQAFWNFRYSEYPALGSGVGSREQNLRHKEWVLQQINQDLIPSSVLDIGCGDLEVSRRIEFKNYTGVDISSEAIIGARRKKRDWNFIVGNPVKTPIDPCQLVICLDVLIHQPTYAEYIALLGRIFSLCTDVAILSGYNQEPWHTSEITFYYEPLSQSLRKFIPGSRTEIVGGYRDTTIFLVHLDNTTEWKQTLYETHIGHLWSKPDDLISSQFEKYKGHTRNELAMLLEFVEAGATILDIGAHIGSFAVPIATKIGPEGSLICVEPDPQNFMRLAQNIALNDLQNRVELVRSIVGPYNRYRHVPHIDNTGAGYFIPDPQGAYSETISLGCLCGDRVPSLIKIDVEGMELHVLESAGNFFSNNKPILYIEVSAKQLERAGSSIQDLEIWLITKNYSLFINEGPRNSTNDEYRIIQLNSLTDGGALFDCLAIPNSLVQKLRDSGELPPICAN